MTKLDVKFSAKEAKFPISLTEGFYDDDYNFLLKDQYRVVTHFKIYYSQFSLNAYSKSKTINMSDTLTTLLNTYDSDAIVNFKITRVDPVRNRYCFQFVGCVTFLPTLTLFCPIATEFIVEGDLVKMLESQSFLFDRKNDFFGVVFKDKERIYLLRKNSKF